MIYLIAYDLVEPHDTPEDYKRTADNLKGLFPTWCHIEKSTWLVSSAKSAAEIRQLLKPALNEKDVLFVARLTGAWASANFGDKRNKWLHDVPFSS